jgi:hypothetical protein
MKPDSFSFTSLDPLSRSTRLTCANFIYVFAFSVSLLRSRRLSENWRQSRRLQTCAISGAPAQGKGFTTTATIQTGFTAKCLLSHPRKPVREANCDPWQVTTDNCDTPVFCHNGLRLGTANILPNLLFVFFCYSC